MDVKDPLRFEVPLYTTAEAARMLAVPRSTLASWTMPHTMTYDQASCDKNPPLIATVPNEQNTRGPTIPFIGIVEALVIAAIRKTGVSMQRIRPAIDILNHEIGIHNALASRKLYTDGAEILYDFRERVDSAAGRSAAHLTTIRNGQQVFTHTIEEYLNRITYGDDQYATVISLPTYEHAEVIADPTRSFGAPIFERGSARVDDVLDQIRAGDSIKEVANDFRVPVDHVKDAIRVALRQAA